MWLLTATAALAHGGAIPVRGQYDWSRLPQAEPGVWQVYEFYASIVLGCGGLLALYVWMAGPGRRRYGWSAVGPSRAQWAMFLSSLAIVFGSLQGPLHELAERYLFGAHMAQHLFLTLLFPPLLIRGIPAWMWTPVVRVKALVDFGKFLTQPIVAVLFATFTLYVWHVPSMYEWALYNHNVHIVEHLTFMTGAVVMWWPVHSRIPEIPALEPLPRMAYLFALTLPMKALGAVITVADTVLYPFYAMQPRVFGLDPMEDQRLGGLFMWLPGGLVIWFTIGWVFFTQFYVDAIRPRAAHEVTL